MKKSDNRPFVLLMVPRLCVNCFDAALFEDRFFHPLTEVTAEYPVFGLSGQGDKELYKNILALSCVTSKDEGGALCLPDILSENKVKQYILTDQNDYPELQYFWFGMKPYASDYVQVDFEPSGEDIKENVKNVSRRLTAKLKENKHSFYFASLFHAQKLLSLDEESYEEASFFIQGHMRKILHDVLQSGGTLMIISDFSGQPVGRSLYPCILVDAALQGMTLSKGPDVIGGNFSMLHHDGTMMRIPATILNFFHIQNDLPYQPLYAWEKPQLYDSQFGKPFVAK